MNNLKNLYNTDSPSSQGPIFRNEQKYLCSEADLINLRIRLETLMAPDPHVGPDGTYLIRSIYFDTYDNRCVRENEDGTSPREKWRIRHYNCDMDHLSLECKLHENTMIHKSQCKIEKDMLNDILKSSIPSLDFQYPPLLNRFLLLMRTELLHPVVLIEYERRPLIWREGNVRVTFDRNIVSSPQFLTSDTPMLQCRPVLPQGMQLLEVKFDQYLPDSIFHAIQLQDMQRCSFSKYYLSRRYCL